jgi:short-subunit dehydrogenase
MPFTDQFDLYGQTALVTGATRGIGKSMAIALAEAGSDIILIQRDENNTSTRDEIRALGRAATIYTADLAHRDQIKGLVRRVLDDGHDISILINCGGIQRRHPADQFPDEDWDEVCMLESQRYIRIALLTFEGNASEPGRSICPGTRCRRLHAHQATKRKSTASRFNH